MSIWGKYKKVFLLTLWLGAIVFLQLEKIKEKNYFSQERLIACDVGQGDAILISQGEKQILVDGGPDAKVLKCLAEEMPTNDREIDLLILTHPDLDHFGGLIEVLKTYQVKEMILPNLGKNSKEFMDLYELIWQAMEKEKTKITKPELAQKRCETNNWYWEILRKNQMSLPEDIFSYKYSSDDLSDMLTKFDQSNYDYNNGSIVIIFDLDHKKFLLTGDMEEAAELAMIRSNLLNKIDVLKIAHHGSKSSSSERFLSIVRPEISLISVGKNNSFGHPTEVVLKRLEKLKSKIFRTDQQGKLVITVENSKLVVRTEFDES